MKHPGQEEELARDDVLINVERKVPADQVIDQDAQEPDGGWVAGWP